MNTPSTHDATPEPQSTPSVPLAEELAEYLENVEEHIEHKLGPLTSSSGIAGDESTGGPPVAPEAASG